MLRKQGCHRAVGVTCITGQEVRKLYPACILKGWEIKAFALIHSAFREVLFLDATMCPSSTRPSSPKLSSLRKPGPSSGRISPGWNRHEASGDWRA